MACEAEQNNYNAALSLYYTAQTQVNTAASLVNLTWLALQTCLANQGGGGMPAPRPPEEQAKPKRKRKRGA